MDPRASGCIGDWYCSPESMEHVQGLVVAVPDDILSNQVQHELLEVAIGGVPLQPLHHRALQRRVGRASAFPHPLVAERFSGRQPLRRVPLQQTLSVCAAH